MGHVLTSNLDDGPFVARIHPLLKKQYHDVSSKKKKKQYDGVFDHIQQSDIQHVIETKKDIKHVILRPVATEVTFLSQVKLKPPVDNTKELLYISTYVESSYRSELCYWAIMKGYMVVNEMNMAWNYRFRAQPDRDPFWLRALETFSALALAFSVMIKPPIKFKFSFKD